MRQIEQVRVRVFNEGDKFCYGVSLLEEPEVVAVFSTRAARMNYADALLKYVARASTVVDADFYGNEDVADYQDIGERVG